MQRLLLATVKGVRASKICSIHIKQERERHPGYDTANDMGVNVRPLRLKVRATTV